MPEAATQAGPFDGTEYFEDDWREIFGERHKQRSGVIFGVANDLLVSANSSGMEVHIATGRYFIEGYNARWDTTVTLPIETYTVHRYDRVIVRLDFVNNTIELDILKGTTTTLPALTQNTSIWEETLAWVDVDNNVTVAGDHVFDERSGATGRGGLINVLATNRPAHLRGRTIIERDTQLRQRYSDGTDWLWVPGTGSEVGCDLAMTAGVNLSTNTAWGLITLETENWDHAGLHSGSNGYIVIPSDGIWEISPSIQFAASGTALVGGGAGATWADGAGRDRHLGLHIAAGAAWTSGTPSHPLLGQQALYTASVTTRMGRSKRFDLAEGDYVSLVARQDQGAGIKVVSASLSARLVGYNV